MFIHHSGGRHIYIYYVEYVYYCEPAIHAKDTDKWSEVVYSLIPRGKINDSSNYKTGVLPAGYQSSFVIIIIRDK